jgi:hypothetical protein
MTLPPLEVADLVRTAGTAFIERNRQWLRWTHIKVLLAITRCRTAALGGHIRYSLNRRSSLPGSGRCFEKIGSSTPNHPSVALSMCFSTWAATPIV